MDVRYLDEKPKKTFNEVKVTDVFQYSNGAFETIAMRIKPVTSMCITYNAVDIENGALLAVPKNTAVTILNGEYVVKSYN